MSEKYLVGIDNGGSEIKCAVFSLDGREVAVASRRLPIEVPHPSWSERDSLEVWEKNAEAIAEALELAGITGADVAGVGLTGYGNGFCLVDAEGNPTYKAIVSTDERANDICDEFAETGVERAIYPMTCQSTWAAQPIALLAWFKRYNPAALEASRWVLGIKDWIRFKLTGEFTTEITEASSTCLCNLHTRAFDPAIFEAAGIADCFEKMPRIIESVESGGTVTAEAAAATGLAEGTPVVGGFFDIDANEFASGVADTETLCLIAGTWSINERLATTANTDYDKNKNTVTLGYRPGYFNVEESWPTSASNFDWFVANFLERDRPGISRGEGLFMCVLRKRGITAHSRRDYGSSSTTLRLTANEITARSEGQFPHIDLNYQEALKFLRGEALVLPPDTPRGIVAVCFDGHPLGTMKNIGSRANNLYPKEWRIKTTHVPDTYTPILTNHPSDI